MGLRGLRALRMAAGLDHHHRFDPGGGARGRHEFARLVDRFDVEKNRPGRAIERKEIDEIAEIDVDLVSQRNGGGEADAVHGRPFDQAGRNRARLRDEGEIAGRGHARGKAGIEVGARGQDAEAVGADEPEAGCTCGLLAGVGERAFSVPEPCGDDDCGRGAHLPGRGDDAGHRWRRRRDDEEIGRLRQRIDGPDGPDPLDLAMARIDETDRPFETCAAKVFQNGATGRGFARASPHDHDRAGRKQSVQTIGRHRSDQSEACSGACLANANPLFGAAM